METTFKYFCKQYEKWLDDCLIEFNEQFGDNRKYHQENVMEDYCPWDFVEFSEGGDAYPHGIGGTGHIPNAVTSWDKSEYFVE